MSTTSPVLTHRRWGRAHSPPTWAWYEQLQPEDLEEDSERSDSEDESNEEDDDDDDVSESGSGSVGEEGEAVENGMDVDKEALTPPPPTSTATTTTQEEGHLENENEKEQVITSEMKGKSRAITPPPLLANDSISTPSTPSSKKSKKSRKPKTPKEVVYNSRPILTIKSSQGFVWNQDLFVPSYIKDRYFVSHSPPISSRTSSSRGVTSMPMLASSADTLNDYEVDVVEIRVTGDELRGLV